METRLTHHCRHEINDTVSVDELADNTNYLPTRPPAGRSYRSLFVITVSLGFIGRAYSRLNFYTDQVDGRKPKGNSEQSLDFSQASAFFGGRLYGIQGTIDLYGRGWYNPVYFTQGAMFRHNYRAESGISMSGKAGNFAFFKYLSKSNEVLCHCNFSPQ